MDGGDLLGAASKPLDLGMDGGDLLGANLFLRMIRKKDYLYEISHDGFDWEITLMPRIF